MERRAGASTRARVRVIDAGTDVFRRDDLATEEPLEIRLAAGVERRSVTVTMRTPGHDFDLVAGWLLAEGVIAEPADVQRIDYCSDVDVAAEQQYNVVTATLTAPRLPALDNVERFGMISSACGVCGKASIDSLQVRCGPVRSDAVLDAGTLFELPGRLRTAQGVFDRTGGLHAAGLFDGGGTALVVREDVGRHNAVDKVVGSALLGGMGRDLPAVLVVSGRTSFEIVQKAVAAGIAFVAGVSAPSSLAVELADRFGVTLVGFLRGTRANVYTHTERIGNA